MDDETPDFYEVVKYVEEEPQISEEQMEIYFEQGMWPDKPHEHVCFVKTEDKAEKIVSRMEEKRTKDGWVAAIRPRFFRD